MAEFYYRYVVVKLVLPIYCSKLTLSVYSTDIAGVKDIVNIVCYQYHVIRLVLSIQFNKVGAIETV